MITFECSFVIQNKTKLVIENKSEYSEKKIQYQYDSILLMVSRIFLKLYLLITEKPMKGTNTN